jgi:hypothetical protein
MSIRDWGLGVICGSTAAYVFLVVLGLLLPSWPFNAFFTTLSLPILLVLWRYWRAPEMERRQAVVSGIWVGAGAMIVLWSGYFIGPVVSLRGTALLFCSVLVVWSWLVYWRYRKGLDGSRRSFVLFSLGAMTSSYLCAALVILLFVNAGCVSSVGMFCPYTVAPFAQPLALAMGLYVYLRLWSRPHLRWDGKC